MPGGCIQAFKALQDLWDQVLMMIQDRLGRVFRDLRLSVVDACNLRCPYCLPVDAFPENHAFLPMEDRLSFDEILRLVQAFVPLGLRKVKLTGGEPLLRPGLADLARSLKAQSPGLELGLISNGTLLEEHLPALRAAGLDSITISLDTLRPDRWRALTGRDPRHGGLARVLSAIEAAAGIFPLIKVNMVPIRGLNEDEIEAMALRWRRPGLAVRFIEFMDVGTLNRWRRDQVIPSSEVRERLFRLGPMLPLPARHPGETAERWGWVKGGGEVGFISSITEPFCGDCSRARLSAEGILYPCLFSRRGLDLRALLRSGAKDAELEDAVASFWQGREDRYSEQREAASGMLRDRIEMFAIGG